MRSMMTSTHGPIHTRTAERDELCLHARVAAANLIDEGRWEGPLAADEETDFVMRTLRKSASRCAWAARTSWQSCPAMYFVTI